MGDRTERLPGLSPQQMACATGHDGPINNGPMTATTRRFFRLNFFTDGNGYLFLNQTERDGYITPNITTGPPHMAQPSHQSPAVYNAAAIQAYHASMVNLQALVQAYLRQYNTIIASNQHGFIPLNQFTGSPFEAAFTATIPYRAPIVITNVCKDCGAVA